MRCAVALLGIGAAPALLAGCRDPTPRAAGAALAACPRDARPDDRGRCACVPGDVPLLGACVPAPVADGYCGPVAKATTSGGCAFPVCPADEAVDVDVGCTPLPALLSGGPLSCASSTSLAVEDQRRVCIPADAACPRGTYADGALCTHGPSCPPGSLPAAGACRPVVLRGEHGVPLIDLGVWSALALGVDGGRASSDLCRPLEAHPLALGLAPAASAVVLRVHVTLSAPDDDVTRVSAEVSASMSLSASTSAQPPAASVETPAPSPLAMLAERAVASMIEPLRGLGGETTCTRVDVDVQCQLGEGAGRSP
jgi:hypothetical protein